MKILMTCSESKFDPRNNYLYSCTITAKLVRILNVDQLTVSDIKVHMYITKQNSRITELKKKKKNNIQILITI